LSAVSNENVNSKDVGKCRRLLFELRLGQKLDGVPLALSVLFFIKIGVSY